MVTKSCEKVALKYFCEKCDYNTSRKSSYDKHLLTAKHLLVTLGDKMVTKSCDQSYDYKCSNCEKKYASRNGLWRHQKSCAKVALTEKTDSNQFLLFADVIKTTVIEIIKNSGQTNNSTNQTFHNSNNKTFNLNFYLNETCKDAINIADFIKSIKIQLEDLETTAKLGYAEGVSNIILNNLNTIDQHKRPIHCADAKREILYIKDQGEWIKECDDKPILTNAIKNIANQNIKQIHDWKNANPDCTNIDSKKNNLYLKIVSNSMSGGSKEESAKNYNKIIKNIIKETVIDKENL